MISAIAFLGLMRLRRERDSERYTEYRASELRTPNSELRTPNSELRTPNSELRTPKTRKLCTSQV